MTSVLIQTIGGLGLFLLGMKTMTDGLQQVAGARVKKVLETVSANRVVGCLTGTAITALIQSSSATTVMLIGFVNAGLMTLQQAVGLILGANIGTTVTAQLIAFRITDAALPAIALGVGLRFFAHRRRTRYLGEVALGFGLLFFGLVTMKSGLAPIKHDPTFISFFTRFSPETLSGMLLCVLSGAGLTMVVQSSSATVGLTMALAAQGLLTFPGAVALVLGENIGTTITAQLATIGGGVNAHRTANAHTLFNVIGVIFIMLVFPYFVALVETLTRLMGLGPVDLVVGDEKPNVGRYVANAHTLFNVFSAVFFLIFLPWLLRAATWLSPRQEKLVEDLYRPAELDQRHVDNPTLAIPQVRREIIRMSEAVETTLKDVVETLSTRSLRKLFKWRRREDALDAFQRDITAYLTSVYQGSVTPSDAKEISHLLRMSNNLERIGDSVENVALLIEDLIENNIEFSPEAVAHVNTISTQVIEFMSLVTEAIRGHVPEVMDRAERMEQEIDLMREEMRQGYIERLRSGVCMLDPSLIFIDMLASFEKMGDYCYNIAQAIAGVK